MTIQVIAEREHKIRSEVKEIQKVFFCNLCNKQYKLAHEFESHLSSYDHNHRKRFKEMREMQSSSGSRDDRQKREQQREEKELAKIAQLADAHRKQQKDKQEKSETEDAAPKNMAASSNQDQRQTLKFGFSKMAPSKVDISRIPFNLFAFQDFARNVGSMTYKLLRCSLLIGKSCSAVEFLWPQATAASSCRIRLHISFPRTSNI
ncbi:uncharacterized LOC100273179 [Zea mays]|uniref:C2H2-type domain-containing protein n=1 Tax=Zea mays TaxID=4577 RepID=B4FTE6_MAIZE|nr:uncharacterized LOC100273179 [Zea mays]ACF85389.1 unknown [Zea mays]|eukprot:NP_001141096.1 uncharacterized protein LOC100273179 [Zea mays]